MSDTEIETGPTEADEAAAPVTVAMVREEPQFAGGPTEADVQACEVGGYVAAGWMLAEGQELPEQAPEADKALEDMALEELRAVADAEGVAFTPRTGVERLRADIADARAKALSNG